MRILFFILIFLSLISCQENKDVSQLYLILREENKDRFEDNNQLLDSLTSKMDLIDKKIKSIENIVTEINNNKGGKPDEVVVEGGYVSG